jgi:hypothetical protein
MDRMHAFRLAVTEIGEASAEQLASYIEQKYGVRIDPKFIPFFRATLLDRERQARLREASRTAAPAAPPGGPTALA